MSDGSHDWLALLKELPDDRIFVQHEPPTPRYGRAQTKLRYVLRASNYLGWRHSRGSAADSIDIALWSPPAHGRGHGYYTCFRLLRSDDEVVAGVLFCFYDGTEKSPGFKSRSAAQAFAEGHAFKCEDHEHH